MLLMHDVTAHNASVAIDNECSITTFTYRADIALRYSRHLVAVGKLVVLLLLHIVSHDTLVGHYRPEVFMTVDKHLRRDVALYAHAAIDLLHVAFEALRLRMIDAHS